jgi:hypothetical protein
MMTICNLIKMWDSSISQVRILMSLSSYDVINNRIGTNGIIRKIHERIGNQPVQPFGRH